MRSPNLFFVRRYVNIPPPTAPTTAMNRHVRNQVLSTERSLHTEIPTRSSRPIRFTYPEFFCRRFQYHSAYFGFAVIKVAKLTRMRCRIVDGDGLHASHRTDRYQITKPYDGKTESVNVPKQKSWLRSIGAEPNMSFAPLLWGHRLIWLGTENSESRRNVSFRVILHAISHIYPRIAVNSPFSQFQLSTGFRQVRVSRIRVDTSPQTFPCKSTTLIQFNHLALQEEICVSFSIRILNFIARSNHAASTGHPSSTATASSSKINKPLVFKMHSLTWASQFCAITNVSYRKSELIRRPSRASDIILKIAEKYYWQESRKLTG